MNISELQLLRKGAWSTTYRDDDTCIKMYNFFEPEAIRREIQASQIARSFNINTPYLIDHYISEGCSYCRFKYIDMITFSVKEIEKNIFLQKAILELLKQISSVSWTPSDRYWYEHIKVGHSYQDKQNVVVFRIRASTNLPFSRLTNHLMSLAIGRLCIQLQLTI